MDKLYQLTNKRAAPEDFPFLRVWIRDNQSTLIDKVSLKLTAREADTNTAFDLHVHIVDKVKNKINGLVLLPDSFLDMSNIGFLVAIRAAEWTGKNVPTRFLVEFISLNKNTTLSVCK